MDASKLNWLKCPHCNSTNLEFDQEKKSIHVMTVEKKAEKAVRIYKRNLQYTRIKEGKTNTTEFII